VPNMNALGAARVARALRTSFALLIAIATGASMFATTPVTASPVTVPVRASFHLTAVSVRDVLARIARAYGADIAVSPDVRGRVSVSVERVTLDQALAATLGPVGATWSRANRVVVVTVRAIGAPHPSE